MKNMKKRALRSAVLLTVSILLLTCMMVVGIFAEDPVKYRLEIRFNLTDADGNQGLAMIRVEMAEGEEIDLDAIIPELLGEECRGILNAYHAKVRQTLAPYMTAEENAWLAEATRAI